MCDVSDRNLAHAIFDKLGAAGIYLWSEVEQFTDVFFNKKKAEQALTSICKPARDRWCKRYAQARADTVEATATLRRAKKSGDAVLIANEENKLKDAKARKDIIPWCWEMQEKWPEANSIDYEPVRDPDIYDPDDEEEEVESDSPFFNSPLGNLR